MTERVFKGKSLLVFPADCVSVDIETTGLSPESSEILEISAVRYRDYKETDFFSSLVRPKGRIPYFITQLTGIDARTVRDAPPISEVLPAFAEYIGDELLIGYNVHFDVNHLYDAFMKYLGSPLSNDFVDVLRFSRKALPDFPERSLGTVARHYGVSYAGAHRALADCRICHACYLHLMKEPALSGIPVR